MFSSSSIPTFLVRSYPGIGFHTADDTLLILSFRPSENLSCFCMDRSQQIRAALEMHPHIRFLFHLPGQLPCFSVTTCNLRVTTGNQISFVPHKTDMLQHQTADTVSPLQHQKSSSYSILLLRLLRCLLSNFFIFFKIELINPSSSSSAYLPLSKFLDPECSCMIGFNSSLLCFLAIAVVDHIRFKTDADKLNPQMCQCHFHSCG